MTADDREQLLEDLFGEHAVPASLSGRLLRTREVARLFQVSERTVAEWARRGRLPAVRTLGGHRLYPADQVRELLLSLEGSDAGSQARAGAVAPRAGGDEEPRAR